MAFYRVPLTASVLIVPGLLLIQRAIIIGMMLLCSALYVLHRDLGALLPLALQILMLISPVLYPVSLVPEQVKSSYLLNPMAALIEAYRAALLYGQFPSAASLAGALLAAVLLFGLGYHYFKSVEQRFADVM